MASTFGKMNLQWNLIPDDCRDVWDFAAANQTANESRILDPTSAATQFWEWVNGTIQHHLSIQKPMKSGRKQNEIICLLRRRLLGRSGGVEELGSVRSDLALCLLLCWLFCFFSIRKGVRSMGKVVSGRARFSWNELIGSNHCHLFEGGVPHGHIPVCAAGVLIGQSCDAPRSFRRDQTVPDSTAGSAGKLRGTWP